MNVVGFSELKGDVCFLISKILWFAQHFFQNLLKLIKLCYHISGTLFFYQGFSCYLCWSVEMDFSAELVELVTSDNSLEKQLSSTILNSGFLSYCLNFFHTAAACLSELQPNCSVPAHAKQVHHDEADCGIKRSVLKSSKCSTLHTENLKHPVTCKKSRRSKGRQSFCSSSISNSVTSCSTFDVSVESKPKQGKKKHFLRISATDAPFKQTFDLFNNDDFPVLGDKSKNHNPVSNISSKQASRRIKPTLISEKLTRTENVVDASAESDFEKKYKSSDVTPSLGVDLKLVLHTRLHSPPEGFSGVENEQVCSVVCTYMHCQDKTFTTS